MIPDTRTNQSGTKRVDGDDHASNGQSGAKLLYTSDEACETLSISKSTLYQLEKSGELCCVRIGRSVRYTHESLRAWIDSKLATRQTA